MKLNKKKIFIGVAAVAIVAGGVYAFLQSRKLPSR